MFKLIVGLSLTFFATNAFAVTTPAQLISEACGLLHGRQRAICGLLIQKEISANLGTVVEQLGPAYLMRPSVLGSTGAFLSLFDQVEQKVGGSIPGAQRLRIMSEAGKSSLHALIINIDQALVR